MDTGNYAYIEAESKSDLGVTLIFACTPDSQVYIGTHDQGGWEKVKGVEAQILFDKDVGYSSFFDVVIDIKVNGKTQRGATEFHSSGLHIERKYLLQGDDSYAFAKSVKNGVGNMRMNISTDNSRPGINYKVNLKGSSDKISKILKQCPQSEYHKQIKALEKKYKA